MRQFKIADENLKIITKSQKKELFSYSSELHPQSCYISRCIHTLHGLQESSEDIKSGKSSDYDSQKSKESISSDKER
ncbi:4060_t:CDS:2 [Diversispora eburnea]|uniref:4060_t:CDS:1 n=1 Tax=Diversispora eburnea TaxID=1213867 RepID=A0A9N9C6A3_9GLOM|nr:4060_t:CDS:2 [Diversispora eburnea]